MVSRLAHKKITAKMTAQHQTNQQLAYYHVNTQ